MRRPLPKALALAFVCIFTVCSFALAACNDTHSNSSSSSSSSSTESSSSSSLPGSTSSASASYTLVKEGKLEVATCPRLAPMEYQSGNDVKGFDIALITEVAKRLGLTCEVSTESYDALDVLVDENSKYDCAISSIAINEARKQQVAFSEPYYDCALATVVSSNSESKSREALAGKAVGALRTSTAERWIADNLADCVYTPFTETSDMFGALSLGTMQAIVCDEAEAKYYIADKYKDCEIIETTPTGEQYGIAMSRENPDLVKAVNQAIDEIRADGTYDKLASEWIG